MLSLNKRGLRPLGPLYLAFFLNLSFLSLSLLSRHPTWHGWNSRDGNVFVQIWHGWNFKFGLVGTRKLGCLCSVEDALFAFNDTRRHQFEFAGDTPVAGVCFPNHTNLLGDN